MAYVGFAAHEAGHGFVDRRLQQYVSKVLKSACSTSGLSQLLVGAPGVENRRTKRADISQRELR
jgi:hypothetical protein